MQFITRAYNSFVKKGNSLVKISKENRLKDEYSFYKNIPLQLRQYYPTIYDFYVKNDEYVMEMEYYAYDNLGRTLYSTNITPETLLQKYTDVLSVYFDEVKKTEQAYDTEDAKNMYLKKTNDEYVKFMDVNWDNISFLRQNTVVVNEQEYKNFNLLWGKISVYLASYIHRKENVFNFTHGDMCFSNTLFGINPITDDMIIKFIDPRGKFGQTIGYGDILYDFAKIQHSIDGKYEAFINDEFKLKAMKDSTYVLEINNNDSPVFTSLNNYFAILLKKHNIDPILVKIIQGTIFIGMCARHYDSIERQKAMFLTGLRILNEVYYDI